MHEASSTPFASFALEYDGGTDTVGNLTEVTEIDSGVVSYDYDALYRLTSEAKTGTGSYSKSYGYDVSGNVTTVNSSSFATYDSSNKLSTISGGSVTHDFFGQVKTASGTGLPTSTYTWNVSQRLASQKLGSGSVRNYWYDAFGRLVRTKDTGLATVYIFDGQRIIGEYSDGAPSAVYTWGADGVVSRRILSSGATSWYHFGPQGETRYLTDSSGSVTDSYTYTAYGVPLSASGSSINPFRYGGKYGYFYDGFTGILRAGERWYAPHLMRWISRDPILFDGGYNVYEYVGGRVIGYHDRSGELPVKNSSGRPMPYKPEGIEKQVLICKEGETCKMDGIYPPDGRPRKFRDTCLGTPALLPDCTLRGLCAPLVTESDLDPQFFEKWTNWPNPYTGGNGWPKGMPRLKAPSR